MPFLSGGYHLPLPAKIALTNASFIAMMWELTDDDETSAGEALENLGAIAQFTGTLYVLWIPPVVKASIAARVGVVLAPLAVPAAIATSAVIVGGAVSYAIDPEEGFKNYKEFISEPTKIPGRLKFTAETIAEKVIQPKINQTQVFLKTMESLSRPYRRRWWTGPYLPF